MRPGPIRVLVVDGDLLADDEILVDLGRIGESPSAAGQIVSESPISARDVGWIVAAPDVFLECPE
jgi:hypothetical protein